MTREEWDKLTPDKQWEEYQGACMAVWDALQSWQKHLMIRMNVPGSVDDNGNPPPHDIQGDMIPRWYDDQWWVNWASFCQRHAEKGDPIK